MKTSYAVKWHEPDGQDYVGRLELGPRVLHLVGDAGGARVDRQIGYDELEGLRIGHDAGERVDGRRTLVIERPQGAYHLTSTVFEGGILQELVDRLSELSLAAPRRATIVVPLKEGALARVRELAAAGPPFDPNETQLTRHRAAADGAGGDLPLRDRRRGRPSGASRGGRCLGGGLGLARPRRRASAARRDRLLLGAARAVARPGRRTWSLTLGDGADDEREQQSVDELRPRPCRGGFRRGPESSPRRAR